MNSGRLSKADFERLAGRAKGGFIKRSDIGRFIAENLAERRREVDSRIRSERPFLACSR